MLLTAYPRPSRDGQGVPSPRERVGEGNIRYHVLQSPVYNQPARRS